MSQRLSALLELCADKVAMSPQQQDLLVTCLQEAGSLLSKLADDKQADGPVARLRNVDDANSEEHALQVRATPAVPCCARDRTLWQELDADDTAAPSHFCTVFGLDVPLKRWAQSAWGHSSNPLPRFFSSIEGPGAYSPLRT